MASVWLIQPLLSLRKQGLVLAACSFIAFEALLLRPFAYFEEVEEAVAHLTLDDSLDPLVERFPSLAEAGEEKTRRCNDNAADTSDDRRPCRHSRRLR